MWLLLLVLGCAPKPTGPGGGVEGGYVEPRSAGVQAVGEDGVPIVKRVRLSKTHPGPPVLYTIHREGIEVFRMVMTERR